MSWYDAPISEAQILEGEPRARSWDLALSREGGVSMNYWDCTAGRFTWSYAGDEMIEILEGEARVTDEAGHTRILRPGDTAHFAGGTKLVWEVPEYVRKLAFNRSAHTLADRLAYKAVRIARSMRARPVRPALSAATAVGTVSLVALPL
jgi:uncharacterized cupin superfamily protein